MRKLWEPAVCVWCVYVCLCCVGGALPAFLLPKTNFIYADLSLCLCRQLVRPVTVVPNVPGIPGPPSPQPQPQPVQSEAKLVLIVSSSTSNVIFMLCLLFPIWERYNNQSNERARRSVSSCFLWAEEGASERPRVKYYKNSVVRFLISIPLSSMFTCSFSILRSVG